MGTGAEVSIDIDAEFADLDDFYPGSKRKRRDLISGPAPTREDGAWDAKPIVKAYNGRETEFFLPGALAAALGKTSVTIRLWERRSYIPKAPFRLPGYVRAGKEVPGKRVYTRELVEIAVEEFAKRDLLGAARVEWKKHRDLTIALYERWSASLEEPAN